jgi:hypothetical protein
MIQVVIFSFDRAMQLSLLLESIRKFDTERLFSVHVLYAFSSEEYRKAYELLKSRYPDTIEWMVETRYENPQINFEFQFGYLHNWYWWLKRIRFRNNSSNFKEQLMTILSKNSAQFTLFLTDDSVFYQTITAPECCLEQILRQPETCSFSLRHGMNLTGGNYEENKDGIAWNVYANDMSTDWGYPFSIDGHIYDSRLIRQIVKKILLNSPNSMEANMACYVTHRKLFPRILANRQSCLAGFELNRVQTLINNHHWNISAEAMNRYYLNGYRLKIGFNPADVSSFRPAVEYVQVQKGNETIDLYFN